MQPMISNAANEGSATTPVTERGLLKTLLTFILHKAENMATRHIMLQQMHLDPGRMQHLQIIQDSGLYLQEGREVSLTLM